MLLAIPLGLAIGLIVGSVGGGGAILALPALVYVLGEAPGPASTASLVVVAVAAALGAGLLAIRGQVCWRLALTFSLPAAAGSVLGAIVNAAVSGRALILAFVPVMLIAAAATWLRAGAADDHDDADCPRPAALAILGGGFAVGALTGFFGVGGGFMIVPVLTLLFGAGFHRAIATSLVIITLTGLAALGSHLAAGATMNAGLTVALAIPTALGAIAGTIVGRRLPQAVLGRTFALVMTAVACLLLVDV
ncbi:MAG: sulfite exporter TauE/SafE family protein, partial [Actinomycetota bacterium]|nr:sulfite exporter TauE/SafE family protein [Actinomycetota bacterium]